MEKKLLLAVSLSLGLMIAWTALQRKMQPIETHNVEQVSVAQESKSMAAENEATIAANLLATETIVVDRGSYSVEFVESLGAIKGFIFHDYRDYIFTVDSGSFKDTQISFSRFKADDTRAVHFRHDGSSQTIIKSYEFGNTLYDMKLRITFTSASTGAVSISPVLIAGILHFSGDNADNQYITAAFCAKDKITHHAGRKQVESAAIEFIALRDRYFSLIMDPVDVVGFGRVVPLGNSMSALELALPAKEVAPGEQVTYVVDMYAGPQDIKIIDTANHRWTAIVHYGPFDVISHLLLQVLGFFYKLVHNWGWSIILLSFATYAILFPLSIKQMRSMKEMQRLQPHIEELRKAYKDNPQKLNKEIMELYRHHKVNPLSGCLPILLQMPIFFALYPVLMRSAFLRGADFLWIRDLSSPDRIATLPVVLPFLKNEVNLLPVVLAILMFVQQKMTLKSSPSSSQAEQQKMMMVIMPIMFGFIFYHMPAGLVLYWLINSILMLVFQVRLGKT